MPRRLTLKISKGIKEGKPLYLIYCPAKLSPDGKARRYSFRRRSDAETHRAKLFAAWQKQAPTPLSPTETADATAALRLLAEAEIPLSLTETIKQALPLLTRTRRLTLQELLLEFENIKAPQWRDKTEANYRLASRKLIAAFGDRDPASITPQELTEWLNTTYPSPASIAHTIRTLNPAFSYALRQKHITENPFSLVERHRAPKEQAIDILTPTEAGTLLQTAPTDCLPAYALLLFAGVRPKELSRLTWGNIRDSFIHITGNIAKTRQVRNVEIHPTLSAWLNAYKPTNAEQDTPIIPPDWKRKDQATRSAAGIANRPDVCRHSYATYYLAAFGSVDALKANMGHSRTSDTLFVHYRAAATPKDAQQYWNLLPSPSSANIS